MKRKSTTPTTPWVNGLYALALALACVMVQNCVEEGDFECEGDHARCKSDKGQGICQPSGYCSYDDASCRETHQRYSPFAGNFARKCVTLANAGEGGGEDTGPGGEDSLGSTETTGSTTSTPGTDPSTGDPSTTTTTTSTTTGSAADSDLSTDASTTN